MSEPDLHHWLPKFLQREWFSEYPGKVLRFSRPYLDVQYSWKGIKTLGGTKRLYRAYRAGSDNPNFVETSFMRDVIDTPASVIHKRMLNGKVHELDWKERELWSRFMVSLLIRHPNSIQPKQERHEETWKEFINARIEEEAAYEKYSSGTGSDLVLQALINFTLSSPFRTQIMNLEWRVLQLHHSNVYFFLGDNPIIKWGEKDIQRLWMPLSPNELFVAGDPCYFSKDLLMREEFREQLAIKVMELQFEQVKEFVIGKVDKKEKLQGIVNIAKRHWRKADNDR